MGRPRARAVAVRGAASLSRTIVYTRAMGASCPLCGHSDHRPGWAGETVFLNRSFSFRECLGCGSQFCEPMPDDKVLREMYGPAYAAAFGDDTGEDGESKQPELPLGWLERLGSGTFVDFGCGDGELLLRARELGWRAIGVEMDEDVAARVRARTGLEVTTDLAALGEGTVDVLHLGDVLEHMTDLERDLPRLIRAVHRDGYLMAQGPLEANASLFTWTIRAARAVRGARVRNTAPYHVTLATARGQRRLFARSGLHEVEFLLREVAWPAPDRWERAKRGGVRGMAQYSLRRASRLVSRLDPASFGNRYFFVGRRAD